MQAKQNITSMDGQTLISFIIPVYNVPAEMLRQCIESIRRLSLRENEREIIVVDDGSDNGTIEGINDLIDDITYVRQKNMGVSAARNRALTMAAGQFIQFVDGDDYLIQSAYEHVLDLLRYNSCDMVMFDFAKDLKDNLTFEDSTPTSGSELMRHRNIHGSVWAYIFKKSILGSLRFTPGVAYGEDEEFTPQLLLRAESVCQTSAKAYFYRQRESSATGSNDVRRKLRRLQESQEVIVRLHNLAETLPTADRLAIQRRVAQLTMDYIYNVIIITGSRHYLDRKLQQLTRLGLFPLPDKDYTRKYSWFRIMTNSDLGLATLMKTLPLLNKER
ncbi:MAG: glycosyltransferase [Prevotella sp.]|nr:glycosyltransferase [Prevotella sp.]